MYLLYFFEVEKSRFEPPPAKIEKKDWYGTGNTVGHAPKAN